MRERIVEALKAIESKWGIKILYACEYTCRKQTGPPSNYTHHIRFIFVRPLDQQLSIVLPIDQHYQVNDGKVEFFGLDLRKALVAVWISDSNIHEWLASPEVYMDKSYFSKSLRDALPLYFSPKACIQHYVGIAQKIHRSAAAGMLVPLGSLYAIVYNLLLCAWIDQHNSIPSYDITQLRSLIRKQVVQQALDHVLKELGTRRETDIVICSQPLSAWIEDQIRSFSKQRNKPPKMKDAGSLDRLYRHILSGMGSNPLYLIHLN